MAIDGTSMRANAGWKTSAIYERLEKLSISLCEERLQMAEDSDEQEEIASTKTPIAKPETIRKAIQQIKCNHEQQHANRESLRNEIEQSGIGTPPQKLPDKVAPERRVNLVDPDCRITRMKEGYCAPGLQCASFRGHEVEAHHGRTDCRKSNRYPPASASG